MVCNRGYENCDEFGKDVGIERLFSFATKINAPLERVMQKIGMEKAGELNHPKQSNDWPRCSYLLYKIKRRIAMTKSQLFANTYWGCPYYFLFFFCCLFLSQSFGDNVKVDGFIAFIVIKEIIHFFGTQQRYSVFVWVPVCKFRYDEESYSLSYGGEDSCYP